MKVFFLLLIISSCSSALHQLPPEDNRQYNYQDVSGDFRVKREKKTVNKKIINRSLMTSRDGNKFFEKSITVSQVGTIKTARGRVTTFRPLASDYEVWLDGKLQKSSLRLDIKNKAMRVVTERGSGNKKVESFKMPKHQQFCFFNQIPECLAYNGLLHSVIKSSQWKEFFVVWDTWPYHQDMLSGVDSNLFATAQVRYEGKDKQGHRLVVDLLGQMILYHFSDTYNLVKMAWISQGISLLPVGQKISAEME